MDCTALCSVHGPAVASLAHLVTGCEAGQVRQDFQNIDTAKLAVVVADILIGLVLSKCHGCSASGVTPTLGGWNGLREMDCLLKVLEAAQGTAGVANPFVADRILP